MSLAIWWRYRNKLKFWRDFDGFMVFNDTFNNIEVISCQSVLLVEETRIPGENHRAVASHWQKLYHIMLYTSPWLGFELTFVVIWTGCIGNCKSNHHTNHGHDGPEVPGTCLFSVRWCFRDLANMLKVNALKRCLSNQYGQFPIKQVILLLSNDNIYTIVSLDMLLYSHLIC